MATKQVVVRQDPDAPVPTEVLASSIAAIAALWGYINGPGSWETNPWVAAVTFTVEQRNIDA